MTNLEKELIRIARLQDPSRKAAIEENMKTGFIDLRLFDDDKGSAELDDEYGLEEMPRAKQAKPITKLTWNRKQRTRMT